MFGSRPLSSLPLSTDLGNTPFNQTNWVNPPGTPKRDWAIASQALGTAAVLITVFTTYVGRPPLIRRIDPLPPAQNTQPLGSSMALTSVVVVQAPFSQVNWPNPQPIRLPTQTQPQGSWTQPVAAVQNPFSQIDWPNPPSIRQPLQTQLLGSWTQPVVATQDPFFKTDWPNPYSIRQNDLSQPLGAAGVLNVLIGKDILPLNWREFPNPRGPLQPVQTQPYGTPGVLSVLSGQDRLPFIWNEWPNPRGPIQPVQTQPLGSGINVTSVPPTPYLMCQLDWPNPQIPRQPYQINTWNVPLSILVTIPVPEPVVELTDTHDGAKKRHEHDKKRKKLIEDDRERNERRRAQIISAFEQVIEGKVSRETDTEQVIAVAEEIVQSAANVLDINTKSDAEFASLLSDLDKLSRILDDYLDADDEDVLVLL